MFLASFSLTRKPTCHTRSKASTIAGVILHDRINSLPPLQNSIARVALAAQHLTMNPSTIKAIKAILDTDLSIPSWQRRIILKACENPCTLLPKEQSQLQLLTIKEAKAMLKVSRTTIWRWVRQGKLRQLQLSDAVARFRMEDVLRLCSAEETERNGSSRGS